MKGTIKILWVLLISTLLYNYALAQSTVTNTNFSGEGSLRQAIIDANSSPSTRSNPYVIDASGVTGTIVMAGTFQAFSAHVLIIGPQNGVLAIDGNDQFRVFKINGTATVEMRDLVIQNGRSLDGGSGEVRGAGGVNNLGELTLVRCTIQNCKASPSSGAGTGNGGGS